MAHSRSHRTYMLLRATRFLKAWLGNNRFPFYTNRTSRWLQRPSSTHVSGKGKIGSLLFKAVMVASWEAGQTWTDHWSIQEYSRDLWWFMDDLWRFESFNMFQYSWFVWTAQSWAPETLINEGQKVKDCVGEAPWLCVVCTAIRPMSYHRCPIVSWTVAVEVTW